MVFTSIHQNPKPLLLFNPRSKPLATLTESIQSISVAGSPIKLQSSIKNLGVHLDSKMSFGKHVSEVCRASYFHIRALRHIRSSLTTDATKAVASSGFTPWLLQLLFCWHICLKFVLPSACSEYPCPCCSSKTLFLSHHTGSDWTALAPGLPANRVSNCYHCFQGVSLPTAFLPCWNSPKIHSFTIASIFCFHYHLCAFEENLDGIFKIIFLSCIQIWIYIYISSLYSIIRLYWTRLYRNSLLISKFNRQSRPTQC